METLGSLWGMGRVSGELSEATKQPKKMKEMLEHIEEKWAWMMDYCRVNNIPPIQNWAWLEAENEYKKHKK